MSKETEQLIMTTYADFGRTRVEWIKEGPYLKVRVGPEYTYQTDKVQFAEIATSLHLRPGEVDELINGLEVPEARVRKLKAVRRLTEDEACAHLEIKDIESLVSRMEKLVNTAPNPPNPKSAEETEGDEDDDARWVWTSEVVRGTRVALGRAAEGTCSLRVYTAGKVVSVPLDSIRLAGLVSAAAEELCRCIDPEED